MRCLAALCLGPLLARAAPRLRRGITHEARAIQSWLGEQLADPAGKFAALLSKAVDRAWRSVEVALAGEQLRLVCVEARADIALIEQIRQFVSVAAITELETETRYQLLLEISQARKRGLIPGPIPSAVALAASTLRFLRGEDEISPEADARELAALYPAFHDSGLPALAECFALPSSCQLPLIVPSVRYFLARAIEGDIQLSFDFRLADQVPLATPLRTGFDRLNDALDRFTLVLIEFLTRMTPEPLPDEEVEPPVAHEPVTGEPVEALPQPAAGVAQPGFAIYGIHLVAPIREGEGGARVAPCPVCLTQTVLSTSSRNWVALRCASCGTEYRASDGSAPPAVPSPARPIEEPEPQARERELQRLKNWVQSGEPYRWVENRKGVWTEPELQRLVEMLQLSRYWPLEVQDVRRVLTNLTLKYKTRGTSWGVPPPHPIAPPPPLTLTTPVGLIRTSDVYRTIDGNRWVPCPLCRSFNVQIPSSHAGEVRLHCPGCRRAFVVDLKKRPAILPPPVPPPAVIPPPTLWSKVRNWFGM